MVAMSNEFLSSPDSRAFISSTSAAEPILSASGKIECSNCSPAARRLLSWSNALPKLMDMRSSLMPIDALMRFWYLRALV